MLEMKFYVILVFVVLFGFMGYNGYALDEKNQDQDQIKELKKKVELLEIQLEKIKMEALDNNPYATGETLNWGRGFNLSLSFGAHNQFGVELGYISMLKVKSRKFINYSNGLLRLGTFAGIVFFFDEPVFIKENNSHYLSSGKMFYAGAYLGTPVMLNFLSFSMNLKCLYIQPYENNLDINRDRWGLGMGVDIEFWYTAKGCITIGIKKEMGFAKEIPANSSINDIVLPTDYKVQLGFKVSF